MSEMTAARPRRHTAWHPAGLARTAAYAAAVWLAVAGSVLHAQTEIDIEPPLVEHEPLESGEAGTVQEFTATVVDDRELDEVLLFHRFAGEDAFDETPMRRVASSSVFTASVETEADDPRAIEYYIQARDQAGNRVIKGYAFSPLVRRMSDEDGTSAAGGSPGAEPEIEKSGGGRRWLYIGLGVLAAGAIAAAATTAEDGETGDANTFTVTLDPPR